MSTEKDGSVFFPIVFHMHQPLGNFPWVFQDAFEKSYQPLLETISKYPKIKVNLHITGPLLLWLKDNQPEYLSLICDLCKKKKQIEIVGGGFYEPILAILPEADRRKQIQMTIHWWESNYGITPRGFWLAERVWTPDLPLTLADSGVEFVFIDDYLFRMAGFSESETYFAYKTEFQGKTVNVFPINERIRYLVPWREAKETIEYLEKARDTNEQIVVMISDAEKMGIWPAGDRTTHDICYVNGYDGKQGWLDSFFEAIIAHKWVKPILISNYLKKYQPRGLIYLPTSSYDKMATWALPTPLRKRLELLHEKAKNEEIPFSEDIKTFATGSFWQNFLVKYPQANIMHKRMLFCRNKMESIREILPEKKRHLLDTAWDFILASQSNDVFWHGLFGGVYYRFLRQTAHKNILQAEKLLDSIAKDFDFSVSKCKVEDVLLDGHSDGILENRSVSCFISSLKGGSIFSLNLKDRNYNFSNVLKRQLEAYHTEDVPAINDRFERWSFQDHFIQSIKSPEKYQSDQYVDIGNFANQKYNIVKNPNESISLIRNGNIILEENRIPVKVTKNYSLALTVLKIKYSIEISEETGDFELYFAPEMNFIGSSYPYKTNGFINGQKFDLEDIISRMDCEEILIRDENEIEMASLSISFPFAVKCIVFPLMSYPKSELGIEKQYQGTSIFPFIRISKKKIVFQIEINLKSL